MDLITHIPGVANSALFTPGANTPSPWNVPITGATDGNSPASATRNMAEIYNRVLFALEALVQASGLPVDHANWAQIIDALRSNGLTYAAGAGTANAHTVAYVPRVVGLTDGMLLSFKAAAANTGPTTLNVSGLGAKPVLGGGGLPLQGGEIVAAGKCMVFWVADLDSFVLLGCTGAALQVGAGTKSSHAAQLGQVAGVVGSVRNLRAAVAAASANINFTADEIVVESALGGVRYCLANFNKVCNLATVGAGGMDVGVAPVSGWVAFYAIYNPANGASHVVGTNATAAAAPETYGGANMPSGYTASALISVLPTTAGSLLGVLRQIDRDVYYFKAVVVGATTPTGFASLSLATAVPRNATRWRGNGALASSASSSMAFAVCPTIDGIGFPGYVTVQTVTLGAGGTVGGTIPDSPIITPQTTFYAWSNGAGTPTFTLNSYGYTF